MSEINFEQRVAILTDSERACLDQLDDNVHFFGIVDQLRMIIWEQKSLKEQLDDGFGFLPIIAAEIEYDELPNLANREAVLGSIAGEIIAKEAQLFLRRGVFLPLDREQYRASPNPAATQ